MSDNYLPKLISPYASELKLIHVGTPGIFHYPEDAFCRKTVCGRDASDCRMTAHTLDHYQPCVVCFEGWVQAPVPDDPPQATKEGSP